MSNQELQAQFKRCQEWNDPEQWALLALAYLERGYPLNAQRCIELAEAAQIGDHRAYTVPEYATEAE